LLLDRDL